MAHVDHLQIPRKKTLPTSSAPDLTTSNEHRLSLAVPEPSRPVIAASSPALAPAIDVAPPSRGLWERISHRLLLRHVVQVAAFWHLLRYLLGGASVLVLNKLLRCEDNVTAVFTFFLCVCSFTSGSTLLSMREVIVGSFLGSAVGLTFAIINTEAAGADVFYADTWHSVWTIPLSITLTYYLLSVFGLRGPDELQLLSAVTATVVLQAVPYTYEPIENLFSETNRTKWVYLLGTLVTQLISVAVGSAVALLYKFFTKMVVKIWDKIHACLHPSIDDDILSEDFQTPMRKLTSMPSLPSNVPTIDYATRSPRSLRRDLSVNNNNNNNNSSINSVGAPTITVSSPERPPSHKKKSLRTLFLKDSIVKKLPHSDDEGDDDFADEMF